MRSNAVMAFSTALLLLGCGGAPESADEEPPTASGEAQVEAPSDGRAPPEGRGDAVADAGWVVDFSRYGPVPLGVSLEEAEGAAPGLIQPPDSTAGCVTTSIAGGRDQVWLMVVDGRVTRVDVRNPDVRTERGAGVGDPEARIHALYPEGVEVEPHKYTNGHYLVVTPTGGGEHRLIFETDGARVLSYRAGVLPEVAWVESCS